MKINAFNLVGITILGSRNGVKVEPGIEAAELSVLDVMGTKLYEKQMQSLRLAYEKLDGSENNSKEEFSMLEEKLENAELINADNVEKKESAEIINSDNSTDVATFAETECKNEATVECKNEADAESKHCEEDDEDEDEDGEVCPDCGKNPCECEAKHENEECQNTVCDLTWLLENISGTAGSIERTLNYYKQDAEYIDGSDYIIPVLDRIYKQSVANEKELIGLLAKVADGLTEEEKAEALALDEHFDCKAEFAAYNELLGKFAAISKELDEVKAAKEALEKACSEKEEKLCKYEHQEYMAKVAELLNSVDLSVAERAAFTAKCEAGEISDLLALKTAVAVQLFDNNVKSYEGNKDSSANIETTEPYATSAISAPDTAAAFANSSKKTENKNSWDILKEYCEK